jgi:hypothetical protein
VRGAGWGLLVACLLGAACVQEPPPCAQRDERLYFLDADGDGEGDPLQFIVACEPFPGFVASPLDCDDDDPAIRPGVAEQCDGVDNDCDGQIDEGWRFTTRYPDADGDGWGDVVGRFSSCATPAGTVERAGDCDDAEARVHPDAPEVCNLRDDDCDGEVDDQDDDLAPGEGATYYVDLDGDGFGGPDAAIRSCLVPIGATLDPSDCDDADPTRSPLAPEVCDGIDNDCDGLFDDSDPDVDVATQRVWHLDADQDGYGDPLVTLQTCTEPWYWVLDGTDCDDADPELGSSLVMRWRQDLDGDGVGAGPPTGILCAPPGPTWVPFARGEDCDDADPTRAPGFPELCDGFDNDCDGLIDDADPVLDPSGSTAWFVDEDGDGYGGTRVQACVQPAGMVAVEGDCDDDAPLVHPGAVEGCNGRDDDCDGLIDDTDPDVDRTDGLNLFRDRDDDGVGDPFTVERACAVRPGWRALTGDCDDQDPTIGFPARWWRDVDEDGTGAGPLTSPICFPDGVGWVQEGPEDCAPDDATVSPAVLEVCGDGIDQDCDGEDPLCPLATCAELLAAGRATGDGIYTIAPDPAEPIDVWCDMTTDGGGWTLVSSSTTPVDDAAAPYSSELASLWPGASMDGIWDGLRGVLGPRSDLRFACREQLDDPDLRVDLVFYDVHWYQELTSGDDASVCFNQNDGSGYDPPPERLDVRTGSVREAGNHWNAGYLEGEDQCGDTDDFTVDFDDRGMDGNQADGTDWGEDDGLRKCGRTNRGVSWFVFVR